MAEVIQISIGELQARTEHYVRQAMEQQRVIITDHGKPVAELQPTVPTTEWVNPWTTRKLLPGFQKSQELGAFKPKPGDRDVTDLISDDRDGN